MLAKARTAWLFAQLRTCCWPDGGCDQHNGAVVTDVPAPPVLPTIAYRALVMTAVLRRSRVGERLWDRCWRTSCSRWSGPVSVRMHGRTALVNFGYAYPVFARQFPSYNRPLVEAADLAYQLTGSPIACVDVGAAVGDTVLLLLEQRGQQVRAVLAVDGDPEFVRYLKANVAFDSRVEVFEQLLSGYQREARSLVRTHRGTASAQGAEKLPAVPLDDVISRSRLQSVELVKVDTDGYDGQVLSGAFETLRRRQPVVLFEWHPLLADRTGNDPLLALEVLHDAGYESFRWYDKRGLEELPPDADEIRSRVRSSISMPGLDLHWDVIAIPPTGGVNPGGR